MDDQNTTLTEIAKNIVALCKEEKYQEVYDRYFTEETRSIEAFSYDGKDPITVGKKAISEKAKAWGENVETTKLSVSTPSVINGNQFIVEMSITTKNRKTGEENSGKEYVLYTIENEKIIEERFFYIM